MKQLRIVALLFALTGTSCGGGSDTPPHDRVTFVFRLHGMPANEAFRVVTNDAAFIAQARAELQLPESQRRRFASGAIGPGDGGHNVGWHWHYKTITLTDSAIELCDGTPSMVEADLDYWLNVVGSFCPWSSYVYEEIR